MQLTIVEKICMGLFGLALALCTLPAYFVALIGPAIVNRLPEEKQEFAIPLVNQATIVTTSLGWRVAILACCWIGVKIEGLDTMRASMGATGRPMIVLMNHTSFMDTILCVALMPLLHVGKVKMMVSDHIFKMPCLGRITKAMGHLSIPFKSQDGNGFEVDKEAVAKNQELLEAHVRAGGIGGWFPEGTINSGDTHKVGVFRAGGMTMAVRIDTEVWCFTFVGNARCWPKKAAIGGLPARIGGNVFRLCDSTHALLEAAKLPEDADERAKSIYLANHAQSEVQAKVDALVADGFVGHRPDALLAKSAAEKKIGAAEENGHSQLQRPLLEEKGA